MQFRLRPHPATSSTPFTAVEADVRRDGASLVLVYRVSGAADLKATPLTVPARRDGLWRTTCFEAFFRPGPGEAYLEFNFSPSGEWAAYRFDCYRAGMTNAVIAPPSVEWSREGRVAVLSARLDLSNLALTPSARLGLSAVLETQGGEKTCWALAHPGDKPDFHRADGFIARLPFESCA